MLGAVVQSIGNARNAFVSSLGKGRQRLAWSAMGGVATLLIPVAVFAFTGQTGSTQISFTGAVSQDKLGTTLFTAPTTVTCMVTADVSTSTQSVNSNPTGTQLMWPLAQIAGSNHAGGQGGYVARTVLTGIFRTSATRLFTVNQNETARFGCRINATGDFTNPAAFGTCTVTYMCIVPQ